MMEINKEVAWLEKLKQYIEDEDKIVTLPYLCKKLELDAQESNNIMKQFVDKHVDDNYAVTYMIMGVLLQAEQHCVQILPAKELSKNKALYKTVSNECVYSIQKSKSTDFSAISMVDTFKIHNSYEPNKGCYISTNCVRRTNLKTEKVKPTVSRAPVVDKAKATHMFGTSNGIDKQVKNETVEKPTLKADQTDKKEIQSKPKINEKQKTNNNLMSMFQKMPSKEKKEEVVKMECDEVEVDIPSEINTMKNEKQDGSSKDVNNIQKVNNETSNSHSKKSLSKAKKRNRQDASSDRSQKKRKRIIQPQEDSDDDIFVDHESDADPNESLDIIISDEEDPPKKSTLSSLSLKSRSQKFVEKTYTDEEGYIVTKKELIIVSEDESEQENAENKRPEVIEPKKKTPLTKKISPKLAKNSKKQTGKPANQRTLIDFFSKK